MLQVTHVHAGWLRMQLHIYLAGMTQSEQHRCSCHVPLQAIKPSDADSGADTASITKQTELDALTVQACMHIGVAEQITVH